MLGDAMTPRVSYDDALAKAIRKLLTAPIKGEVHPRHQRILDQDIFVKAYFQSVADADAWTEEIIRIRHASRYRVRSVMTALPLAVIKSLLPTWREWGRIIVYPPPAPEKDQTKEIEDQSAVTDPETGVTAEEEKGLEGQGE